MKFSELNIGDKFMYEGEEYTKVRPAMVHHNGEVFYFNSENEYEYVDVPDDYVVNFITCCLGT